MPDETTTTEPEHEATEPTEPTTPTTPPAPVPTKPEHHAGVEPHPHDAPP